jgi:hypothetical protein
MARPTTGGAAGTTQVANEIPLQRETAALPDPLPTHPTIAAHGCQRRVCNPKAR